MSAIALDIVLAPAGVEAQTAALAPTRLFQALPERRQFGMASWIARDHVREHADPPHLLGLLRALRAAMSPRCQAQQ